MWIRVHILVYIIRFVKPCTENRGKMHVESNVIYGMISGLALLMDVHHPDEPNGYGLIHISGSGWGAPLGLDARPLKESAHV